VLVTAPVADLLAGSATAAGRRMLRGFDNPVEVWSLSSPA
jgi:class 3 adenylate cyclase